MKDILIVINGLGCGGAEKSLISFLSTLENKDWNIDLLVMNPKGMLMSSVPAYVNVINDAYDIENYMAPMNNRRKKVCGFRDFINQCLWFICDAPLRKKYPNFVERRWRIWGRHLPRMKKKYDLAVSYMHSAPNYYVIDKVQAKSKILWIHNEFEKLKYDLNFERRFFLSADKVVTISQACADNFTQSLPECKDKILVLENISSAKVINSLAKEEIEDSFFEKDCFKFLSIGRLSEQKGFDIAVETAKMLKNSGMKFIWYILGEGGLRGSLEDAIKKNGLEENVFLTGIKENPYPYIAACDIFVQPSRFEGKSIALDEAKILFRPIVVTNYKTVGDSIVDGKNGVIVELSPQAVFEAMKDLVDNPAKREQLSSELRSEKQGNEEEIEKYIELFESLMV